MTLKASYFAALITLLGFLILSRQSTDLLQNFSCTGSNNKINLAYLDSFGFFDDIDDNYWQIERTFIKSSPIFMYNTDPEKGSDNLAIWLLNNVDPIFSCPHRVRVGGKGDGGKWTCDPHRLVKKNDCLIYSIGSRGNYRFEDGLNAMVKKQCEIHVIDPNPQYARASDKGGKISYHAWGLKTSYKEPTVFGKFDFLTLNETMNKLGHTGRRIDIFKVDCEGCEWTSYQDWMPDKVDIRQILIETHPVTVMPQNTTVSELFRTFRRNGFIPFSKEANTHPAAPKGTLFEFGFVRMNL